MAASDRSDLLKKADKLPFDMKHHILTFFGKIGTKDFKYSKLAFEDKAGQTKFPTFYGNLMVLCSYMDRAKLGQTPKAV